MDPLRPFADLVRSVWGSRSAETRPSESTGRTRTLGEQQPNSNAVAQSSDDLRTRLRARLSSGALSDEARARETFVEVVLAWELGERVQSDPAFAGIVKTVADRIAERPQLSGRLHELLVSLVRSAG